ncbi:MAG: M28 family peptidase [Cyclobacteriaceae bacterium]|nr:M28 family peptidase [Cyclobacteriaceae bacterium]
MRSLFSLLFFISASFSFAQKKVIAEINSLITPNELEAHLSFLAADEMRGRDTGSPELRIAGNYIASWFHQQGLSELPGSPGYFQPVNLEKSTPANAGSVSFDGKTYVFKENLLVLAGANIAWEGSFVFVGYGSAEELDKADIAGKMVLALAGSKEADNINKVFSASNTKYANVTARGGAGLVEFLTFSQIPFPTLVNFFSGGPRWGWQVQESAQPHIWLKPDDVSKISYREGGIISGTLAISGQKREPVPGRNVVGLIEGTDAKLKEEYIIVTAHYDHIGVGRPTESGDSIFNGARDNAIGVVALLQVAKYLSQYPPKRSVMLVALTSEEKGLLGSRWYVEHPLAPLNKHVLNINCDGVGYNDKSIITSISLGRTTADKNLLTATKAFKLGLGGDPDPKEGFFERSDQVSFATKGIPAIKLQPGLARMDDEIRKYYHRQADEVSTLDFDYLTKFYKTFVYSVSLLANEPVAPFWNKGDKYEAAAIKLYNR